MAPGYLTDPFTLNNSVYDCHTCNCTNIPVKKYNLSSSGQCKFAYKFRKLWTLSRNVYKMRAVEIFKTHILTVSHERCTHLQTFRDIYAWVIVCI